MKFSLITVTMGREAELARLRDSLFAQTYRDFEWIVVDQRIEKTTRGSLSAARNLGLSRASGDVVAFPDDDVWYESKTLEKVAAILSDSEVDGVSFRLTDECGVPSAGWMSSRRTVLSARNIWHTVVSCSIFLKRSALGSVRFDERLGVGSGTRFGSGEETDLMMKLIERGGRFVYEGGETVFHPRFNGRYTMRRGWLYGNGCGFVLCRHRFGLLRLIWMVLSQGARAVQALLQCRVRKAAFHVAMAFGRIWGYVIP